MATPGSDGKNDFPGATPIFDHEHALASVQRAREGLDFLRRWDGDGAAHSAATMPCRVQSDFPIRELRCQSTGT
jgi:hypothetical protein